MLYVALLFKCAILLYKSCILFSLICSMLLSQNLTKFVWHLRHCVWSCRNSHEHDSPFATIPHSRRRCFVKVGQYSFYNGVCIWHVCSFTWNVQFLIHYIDYLILFSPGAGMPCRRPSITKKFPQLVSIVEEFIEQHSAAAHNRRREDTMFCHGVSVDQIRKHFLQRIPELPAIPTSTIRRLLLPPNKNRNASKSYIGLVSAKRPPKRNDLVIKHQWLSFYLRSSKLCEWVVGSVWW